MDVRLMGERRTQYEQRVGMVASGIAFVQILVGVSWLPGNKGRTYSPAPRDSVGSSAHVVTLTGLIMICSCGEEKQLLQLSTRPTIQSCQCLGVEQ